MWFFPLLLLLTIYAFGPGLLLVKPLRLAPAERLVAAVGVGLFLAYLLGFAVFAFKLPPAAYAGVSLVCVVLGALGWREAVALVRWRQTRRLLLVWATLLVWGVVLASMVRHYGGGTWGGDWLEHYQRSVHFLSQADPSFDPNFKFIGLYPLPMRPPAMNVVTIAAISQVARSEETVEAFQIAFVFLNSLVVLPLAVLVPRLVRLSPRLARKAPWTLAAVLAASPMFDQNLTYAWTKLFAAFYALAAIAVYLRAWRRGEAGKDEGGRLKDEGGPGAPVPRAPSSFRPHPSSLIPRFVLAFALLCAGFLVHFSVGPYALFLGLHYLFAVWWRRPRRVVEAALIGSVSAAVLASWFAWSVAQYGAKTTFTSTSAVSDAVVMTPAQNAANIARNLGNTLLPTIVRAPWLMDDTDLQQTSAAGRVRDFAFLIYQVSLPGGIGSVGCVLAVYLLWRAWGRRRDADGGGDGGGAADLTARPVRRFWVAFVPVIYVVGTTVYGGVDRFGVAHICLQPLILLGLGLVAGGVWRVSVRWRGWLLVGLLLDFAVGGLLHLTLEHHLFRIDPVYAAGPDGRPFVYGYEVFKGGDVPSRAAQNNLKTKLEMSAYGSPRPFWGDRFGDDALPALQFAAGGLLAVLLFKGLAAPGLRPTASRADGGGDRGFPVVMDRPKPAGGRPSRGSGRRR